MSIILRGITWNHTRGLLPLQATAQRYSELFPEVEIQWDRRSLKAFEDSPIQLLAEVYDLLVIDHPFVGYAAKHGTLVALDEYLSADFLADQAQHTVGASHRSYDIHGHHWALAIDAATPVAMWRPDLMQERGLQLPKTWDEVLELASHGMVEVPAAPINCLMNFYMLCLACGEEPFLTKERVVSTEVGNLALEALKKLLDLCSPDCLGRNPIQSCEMMAAETQSVYCPLAYGYSNYARKGYSPHLLEFGDIPLFGTNGPLRSTLGGTGLAISAGSRHRTECLDYAQFVARGDTQSGIFAGAGGQPGHRLAWLDEENNHVTNGYFQNTLPTLDRAYLRPRYCGYLEFQDQGGLIIHDYFSGKTGAKDTLRQLDLSYLKSLQYS